MGEARSWRNHGHAARPAGGAGRRRTEGRSSRSGALGAWPACPSRPGGGRGSHRAAGGRGRHRRHAPGRGGRPLRPGARRDRRRHAADRVPGRTRAAGPRGLPRATGGGVVGPSGGRAARGRRPGGGDRDLRDAPDRPGRRRADDGLPERCALGRRPTPRLPVPHGRAARPRPGERGGHLTTVGVRDPRGVRVGRRHPTQGPRRGRVRRRRLGVGAGCGTAAGRLLHRPLRAVGAIGPHAGRRGRCRGCATSSASPTTGS